MTTATTDVNTSKPKTVRKKAEPKPLVKLSPNPFMFEVFELTCKQRTRAQKIEILREYYHDSIVAVLLWNFVPSFVSAIPEGNVPFSALKELELGNDTLSETVDKQIKSNQNLDLINSNNRTSLRNEYTILYNFIQGGNIGLSSIRRETMFINMLEGLHPREAEIIILTKDKRLTDKYNLPFDLIREAYPNVQWDR